MPQQYDATPHQPTATLRALPPAPHRGGQYRACPHCGARHIVGQMLCLSCGVAIIKPSSQKQRKKVKTARWFAAEAASQAAGKPKSELSVQEVLNEMRCDYSTSRGSQSLDGEALDKAKQQLKQAQKRGFSSILERFDNDVDFTLHSVAGGFDREFLAIEDVLTHSALPNLGRSQEQRTLGVGAYGGGHQSEMARNEAIARVLYMHDVNPAALRAGLIDAVTDLPFCVMWVGGTYSIRKFVDVILQHKIAQQVVMFSGGPIHLDHTAGYTAEQWHQWIVDRLRDQTAVARRACPPTTISAMAIPRLAPIWSQLLWGLERPLSLSARSVLRHDNRYSEIQPLLEAATISSKTQKDSMFWTLIVAQQQLRTFATAPADDVFVPML